MSNLPILKPKKKLSYSLIIPLLAIPIVLLVANHADKAYQPTSAPTATPIVMPTAIPTVIPTPSPSPTPIVQTVYKTVTKTIVKPVKYSKVYVKTTAWQCSQGKCRRHIKVYGRI